MRPILAAANGEYPHAPMAAVTGCPPHELGGLDRWTRAAFRLLGQLAAGRLTVVLPDGRTVRFDGAASGPEATLRLHDGRALRRCMLGGDLGFAEAVIDGQVDSPDMPALIELLVRNKRTLSHGALPGPLRILLRRLLHALNANTRRGSRRNIARHYDLGNAFYACWLDPSMTYSAARFEHPGQSLEAAQATKYRRLAHMLDLRPGQLVLEIGCGWGGFAELAAREFGCTVHGVTLSREQHAYAAGRIRRAGLADRVTLEIRDYRDLDGHYDRIASIEMVEAVGERYWPSFFRRLHALLRPGGRAALQAITLAEDGFREYRSSPDFIQRHIFPGGMLPTLGHLHRLGPANGLDVRELETFGADYARTLALWRERFLAGWETIAPLGFDDRFRRMWDYYLAYCEGGFRAGHVDVCQIAYGRA